MTMAYLKPSTRDWLEVDDTTNGMQVVGYMPIHSKVLIVATVNFHKGKPIDGARFYVVPVAGDSHARETAGWQRHGAKNQALGRAMMGRVWELYNGDDDPIY